MPRWLDPGRGCDLIPVCSITYLLILRGVGDNVIHENRQEISDSLDTSGEGSIWRVAAWSLTSLACGLYPLSGYRVYDIEDTKLVTARGLFEVSVDLLNQN
jgi:hypothetical protein